MQIGKLTPTRIVTERNLEYDYQDVVKRVSRADCAVLPRYICVVLPIHLCCLTYTSACESVAAVSGWAAERVTLVVVSVT